MRRIGLSCVMLCSPLLLPAAADDAPTPPDFDATFAVTGATDYFDNGLTQSDNHAVLQPEVSFTYGLLYGSVWLSNIDYDTKPDPDTEWEIIAGIAPTLGDWSFDLNVTRYQYPGDIASQYTYLFGSATYDFGNGLSLGGGYAYYWYDKASGLQRTLRLGRVRLGQRPDCFRRGLLRHRL